MSIEAVTEPQPDIERYKTRLALEDGRTTKVHVARYNRDAFLPKVVVFDSPTPLVDWCSENGQPEAIVGGFFLRETEEVLGQAWTGGVKRKSAEISNPWGGARSCLSITNDGVASIGQRNEFPERPENDLLQAGPGLVRDSQILINPDSDVEGFSQGSGQFDSDITVGRHPRAALGISPDSYFSVVCDGRSPSDAGLSLKELAHLMLDLGATDALNLDGGSSATLVSNGVLRNRSRVEEGVEFVRGRPIFSAIAFIQK